ncbi:2,3,4,5-tetrahydropyridine-2,6-dicarboxylate N-succinyltransferase [bacterium]|nr:2,3,4,5-tetrahydropyridine-2,6-dicarboxylate N-succinyltransferase [bacterium]
MKDLIRAIELAHQAQPATSDSEAQKLFAEFKSLLNTGRARAAEKIDGQWQVNHWVKKGVLLGFRLGELVDYAINGEFRFFDKSTYPLKKITVQDNVRQVPGGSSTRDGAFLADGVVIMPPAYVNVAAYVDRETMIDSHTLVGSCAQIGKRVHLSAGSQIGGVLEPIGAMPVIIEDNVLIGGNSGIYDGTIVGENAVIGAGTILTGSTPVYDLVKEKIYRKTEGEAMRVPPNAVVVPGSRPIDHSFARKHDLAIYAPVIVKYRDEKTARSSELEDALR